MAIIEDVVSSSSTVPPQKIRHDVFLSFRGTDTRKNFISHLHNALCRANIAAYIDERLETGGEISSALRNAIRESEISVVVFSENYASSTWCLDELAHILDCRSRFGHTVVPVFYNVDPSDVRKQGESYECSFDELENRFRHSMEKVRAWRLALTEAANLSGFDSQVTKPDSKLINEIVRVVLERLNQTSSSSDDDFKGLVGIRKRFDDIQSLMCVDSSSDVLVIGIWGIGGIGKTTLASLVYNRLQPEFDSCCFFSNAREEIQKHGALRVRDTILAELLQEENLRLRTPILQSHYVKQRLRRKKVLLVLDDVVDDICEFEWFRDKDEWFGPGSRIMVTTRDSEVVKNIEDREVYEVEGLDRRHAAELFRLKAFKAGSDTADEFSDLSRQVVEYCSGVPLALSVIGSHLRGRERRAWESAVSQLAKAPHEAVQRVLRVSYDSMTGNEKLIFLDVACFFKGEERSLIESFYDFCPAISIDMLVEKAVITIQRSKNLASEKVTPSNRIWMHDLIQQMGREIVAKSSTELGRRSRLWQTEDVVRVLETNAGTASIEGVFLDMSKIKELKLGPKSFSKMHSMRLLKIYDSDRSKKKSKVSLRKGLGSLPNSLVYLHWLGFPCKSLPRNFNPRNLVELSMPYSHVDRLWDGAVQLGSLKRVDLRFSKITQVPDLSEAAKLESLDLYFCESLIQLPTYLRSLEQLAYLNLGFCSSVETLPELSGKNMKSLLASFTSISEVPSWIENLSSLETLWLAGCLGIDSLPPSICKLDSLRFLNLAYSGLEAFPEIARPMNSLGALALEGTKIKELPPSIHRLVQLTHLSLNCCVNLELLPDSIGELEFLEEVNILECSKLEKLPQFESSLPFVNARGCVNLDARCTRFVFDDQLVKRKMVHDSKIGVKHWENFADQTGFGSSFMKHCPGREIPRWFYQNKIKDSSLMNIALPPTVYRSSKTDSPFYFRFCLCVVVEFEAETVDRVLNFRCRSQFGTSKGESHEFWCILRGLGEEEFDEIKINEADSYAHVFLWHDYGLYVDDSEDYMFTEASFEFYPVDGSNNSVEYCCKVIESGVCVRYFNSRDSDFTDPEPLTLSQCDEGNEN